MDCDGDDADADADDDAKEAVDTSAAAHNGL